MPVAPLPVIAGTYYARAVGDADGKQVTNVFTFQHPATPLGDATDAFNASVVAAAVAAHFPTLASQILHLVYNSVEADCYPLGSPLVPKQTHAMTGGGGVAGAKHLIQVAAAVKHTVTRRGRGSQSHTYFSPLSIDSITVNGDQLVPTAIAALTGNFTPFINDVIAQCQSSVPGVWNYVQLSKFHNKIYTPNVFPITGSVPETLISSQKRRLGR